MRTLWLNCYYQEAMRFKESYHSAMIDYSHREDSIRCSEAYVSGLKLQPHH